MKPEKKPFVVEIKNRHRLFRHEHSIWSKVDLKAASDQVAAEQMARENDPAMTIQPSDAVMKKTSDINA